MRINKALKPSQNMNLFVSLVLISVPALIAIPEALYLPHFEGNNAYTDFLKYLHFRPYVFLLLFLISGLVTIFIIIRQKETNIVVPAYGIALCLVSANMVYIWSAIPQMVSLNNLFYLQIEDPGLYYVDPNYIWLTMIIVIVTCLIGLINASIRARSWRSPILRFFEVGCIAVFPLPVYVYFFDRKDFFLHVTNNFGSKIFLWGFTNADLLVCASVVSLACITVEIKSRRKSILANRENKLADT